MRRIIADFYFTVLMPLSLVVIVSLWNPIRIYCSVLISLRRAEKMRLARITTEPDSEDTTLYLAKWKKDQLERKRQAEKLILSFSGALSVFIAFTFVNDRIKLYIAGWTWQALSYAIAFCFIFALGMAFHYAGKRKWLKFSLCVLALLLAAAGAEHIYNQSTNTWHMLCPDCSEDDPNPPAPY